MCGSRRCAPVPSCWPPPGSSTVGVATTHWMHADDLARRYPQVDVRPDVLYIDDADVLTSASKTADLDLCIHLVRLDLGATAANGMARRLVVPAHRSGGQAQFISPPAEPRNPDGLGPTLEWAGARLDQPLTVRDLASHAGLSTRQLARRMHTELQAGPLEWLQQQRVARAQELLERTDASVEQIAGSCGMGTAATLRRHFHRAVGVSPTAYRATFRLRAFDVHITAFAVPPDEGRSGGLAPRYGPADLGRVRARRLRAADLARRRPVPPRAVGAAAQPGRSCRVDVEHRAHPVHSRLSRRKVATTRRHDARAESPRPSPPRRRLRAGRRLHLHRARPGGQRRHRLRLCVPLGLRGVGRHGAVVGARRQIEPRRTTRRRRRTLARHRLALGATSTAAVAESSPHAHEAGGEVSPRRCPRGLVEPASFLASAATASRVPRDPRRSS